MIDKETIERVAKLARLNLTKSELKQLNQDLTKILTAFKTLEKVKTKKVKPTFQPIPVKNILRPDKVKPGLTKAQALAGTKHKEKGFFKGPKVV